MLSNPQQVLSDAQYGTELKRQALVRFVQLLSGQQVLTALEESRQLVALYRQANQAQPGQGYDQVAEHWLLVTQQIEQLDIAEEVVIRSLDLLYSSALELETDNDQSCQQQTAHC